MKSDEIMKNEWWKSHLINSGKKSDDKLGIDFHEPYRVEQIAMVV